MNILINLTLMLGLILAVMTAPLLYWRSFRAHPAVTLLVTLLSLFVLIGAAMSFDRLFPGCRSPDPSLPHFRDHDRGCIPL
jgi:hypothetical protein